MLQYTRQNQGITGFRSRCAGGERPPQTSPSNRVSGGRLGTPNRSFVIHIRDRVNSRVTRLITFHTQQHVALLSQVYAQTQVIAPLPCCTHSLRRLFKSIKFITSVWRRTKKRSEVKSKKTGPNPSANHPHPKSIPPKHRPQNPKNVPEKKCPKKPPTGNIWTCAKILNNG